MSWRGERAERSPESGRARSSGARTLRGNPGPGCAPEPARRRKPRARRGFRVECRAMSANTDFRLPDLFRARGRGLPARVQRPPAHGAARPEAEGVGVLKNPPIVTQIGDGPPGGTALRRARRREPLDRGEGRRLAAHRRAGRALRVADRAPAHVVPRADRRGARPDRSWLTRARLRARSSRASTRAPCLRGARRSRVRDPPDSEALMLMGVHAARALTGCSWTSCACTRTASRTCA